jgi:hypothetical protein
MDNSQWHIKNPRPTNVLLRHEKQLIIQPYPTVPPPRPQPFPVANVLPDSEYCTFALQLHTKPKGPFWVLSAPFAFFLYDRFTLASNTLSLPAFNVHAHKPAALRAAWIL